MKQETWKWLAVIALGILALSYFGYIQLGPQAPEEPETPPGTPPPEEPIYYEAAAVKYTVHSIIDGSSAGSSSTGYLDVGMVSDGVWDPLTKSESCEFDADPDNTVLAYNYGDTLIIHLGNDKDFKARYSNETYDRWFYCSLAPGEPVRELTPSILSASQSSPSYKYTISGTGLDTGWDVQYIAGTTPYWGLGALELYPRAGLYDVDLYLEYSGTNLATVTAADDDPANEKIFTGSYGGNGINQTNQGATGTDVTLSTDAEEIYLHIKADTTDICYGLPQYALSQKGQLLEYRAVVVFATNATGIGVSALTGDGWNPVTKVDVTAEVIYYQAISGLIPTRGTKWSGGSYEISIDASALSASTAYNLKVWVLDWQLPANVANGALSNGTSASALPTVYGMVTEYGADSTIHKEGWQVSSGKLLGCQIAGDWTTAA